MDLLLVRHGVTDWNEQGRLMGRLDVELNARGGAQAEALGAALRTQPIRRVLASPQRRAQQTAEAIARVHGIGVHTEAALAEVWIERWEGRTWGDLQDDADVARYLTDPTYVCDAIEPGAAVRDRVVGLVARLPETDGAVVLVSHGDPLRILLAHFLAMPFPAYRRLEVAPGSVSRVRLTAPAPARVLLLNWRPERGIEQLALNAARGGV